MDQKLLFQQLVSFITSVHQVKHEVTKGIPVGDVTPVQYSILELIAVEQPITVSQISDCMDMSMPNTSRELKKLMDKELCLKYDAADDRRKQYIRLSPSGEELMNKAFAHIWEQVSERIKDASDEELVRISQAMELLQSTMFRTSSSSSGQ